MKKHAKILSVPHSKKWFLLLFLLVFAQVITTCTCDDAQSPPGTTPTEGLLCISDCAACPVICSPPPSPVNAKPPPSCPPPNLSPSKPRQPSPPWRYYSPSQPYIRAPPPASFPLPLPPEASPPPPPRPPPPSISWGNAAPPPPSFYYGGGGGNVPSVQAPPGMGQKNYSYPYYYYYASKASSSFSFSFQGSSIFALLLSIHALYLSS